jgi:hypothetical protein
LISSPANLSPRVNENKPRGVSPAQRENAMPLTRARGDAYEAYNYEAGIKPLIENAMGVQTFREDRAEDTEFMTISYGRAWKR